MPQLGAHEPGAHRTFAKTVGEEPLPGYVLIEPLGAGGFGEVWKCEAPGGLLKAIKFVTGKTDFGPDNDAHLRQEFEAFQQVKAIRHPFLLSLERVELVDDQLIMVMELADRQLGDRFHECRRQSLPGIPRTELLGYLREAAEALDVIAEKYGLQHLDVKPANLFLTAGHVQVGDYGLVSRSDGGKKGMHRGLTPRYAAPEVLCGDIHSRSDQYSLALVYHELLTGTFPYTGQTAQQLMLQHVTVPPDLRALPTTDRAAVGTALAKKPEERFESCVGFVQALISGMPDAVATGTETPSPNGSTLQSAAQQTRVFTSSADATQPVGSHAMDRYVPPQRRARPSRPANPRPIPRSPISGETSSGDTSLSAGFSVPMVRLEKIYAVIPVPWLLGHEATRSTLPATDVVAAIVRVADLERGEGTELGELTRFDDGVWECRFLTSIDPRLGQVKLDLLWEEHGVKADSRQAGVVLVRKYASITLPGLFALSKKPTVSGYELTVRFPELGCGTGEVNVTASFFGSPPSEFIQTSEKEIVALIEGVQRVLNTIPERRKHPRIPAAFALRVFPLNGDGRVELPVNAVCRDVSLGGLAFGLATPLLTKYLFVAFEGVPEAENVAILAQIVRSETREGEIVVSARYRLDIGASTSNT